MLLIGVPVVQQEMERYTSLSLLQKLDWKMVLTALNVALSSLLVVKQDFVIKNNILKKNLTTTNSKIK